MNPIILFQFMYNYCGWNKYSFKIRRVKEQWKLTYTSEQKVNDYTASLIIQTLLQKYRIVRYTIKEHCFTVHFVGVNYEK